MTSVNDRIFGLDLLRASAISFVVLAHAGHLLPRDSKSPLFGYFVFDGVTMFFVLSGFLIGRILFRTLEKEPPTPRTLLNFWVRRWFRTLPAYYLVLVLLLVLTWGLNDRTPPIPESIALYFLFAQNLAWEHPEYFGEAWSLAVEEWFYFLVPIPLFLISRACVKSRQRLILTFIICVVVAVTATRLMRIAYAPPATVQEWGYALKMQVVMRMDSLMFGVFGAYLSLYATRHWSRVRSVALVAGVSLLIFDQFMRGGPFRLTYLNYFALTVTPLAVLMLLPWLSSWRRSPGPVTNTVTFISLISYSMYLLNQAPILETILPWLMPRLMYPLWRLSEYSVEVKVVVYLALTVGCSWLLYRFFELPVMNLRDRWSVRDASRPSDSAVVAKRVAEDIPGH